MEASRPVEDGFWIHAQAMTGILFPFKRKMKIEKRKDGWWVLKKYHGYWYEEVPIALPTKKMAEEAMSKLQDKI